MDPAGAWLAGWRTSFTHLEIPVLRSHMLAHPDPRIELALVEAEMACRTEQREGEEEEARRSKKKKGRGGKDKAPVPAPQGLFGWVRGVTGRIDSLRRGLSTALLNDVSQFLITIQRPRGLAAAGGAPGRHRRYRRPGMEQAAHEGQG